MTSSLRLRRFAFAYGYAFALFYVIALKFDLAMFTVYPSMGVVLLGTHHSRDHVAPSMAYLAQYEARQRAGVALYPAPLSADEINVLINLGWLREGAESDKACVGDALAAVIRNIGSRLKR
jgi:hypothetical protein